MATLADFETALAAVDAETTRIGARIDELVADLKEGGLTEAEEAKVYADLTAAADRLKGVGASVETPVPEPEPINALPVDFA